MHLCELLQLAGIPFPVSFGIFTVRQEKILYCEAVACGAYLRAGRAAQASFGFRFPDFVLKVFFKNFFKLLCVKFSFAFFRAFVFCLLCFLEKFFAVKFFPSFRAYFNEIAVFFLPEEQVEKVGLVSLHAFAEAVFALFLAVNAYCKSGMPLVPV